MTRINDFDLGVGGTEKDFIRVSEVCADVSMTEIKLITWLLLEQEYGKTDETLGTREADAEVNKCQIPSVGPGGDSTDAIPLRVNQVGYGFTKRSIAKKYSEELLRAVGVSLPFELLTESQRVALFRLFSSQSDLLRQEKYSSILDLYEALRRRSKFREEFEILDMLGNGQFGVVYAVQTKDIEPSKFALKQINISSFDAYDSIMMILNEAKILKSLGRHPNIVSYADAWLEVQELHEDEPLVPVFFLMMELGHLPLKRWRDENPTVKLSDQCIYTMSKELLGALEWIHSKNYLHLDINPRNILWADTTYTSVKIADFGLAVHSDNCHERRGTIPYYAPENSFNAKSDVYSLGVTLLQISQNIITISELINRIDSQNHQTGVPFLDEILSLMLRKQPSQRPTATEMLTILDRNCSFEES